MESNELHTREFWGPILWRAIHVICAAAPKTMSDETKTGFKNFLLNLQYVLPCALCQDHYRENLQKHPIEIALNSGDLFKWSVDMHNEVNKMNGKPSMDTKTAMSALIENKSVQVPTTSKQIEQTHMKCTGACAMNKWITVWAILTTICFIAAITWAVLKK